LCARSRGWCWYRWWRGKLQQLALHLVERQTVGRNRGLLRFHLPRELGDGFFEIGIVARKPERGSILRERGGQLAAAMMDFPEAADGGEIFRSVLEDVFELALRRFELIQLEQRAAERDACGKIAGVYRETGAARLDRFFELTRPPEFLRELRKRNRRRILLDPASKVVDALIVGHRLYGVVMSFDALAVRPTLSVTINVTV
jgi:hypothetical protein